jgi:hypothetical protein
MAKEPLAKTLGPKAQKRALEDAAKEGIEEPTAGEPKYEQKGAAGGRTRVIVPVKGKDGNTKNYEYDHDPNTDALREPIVK